MKFVTLVVLLAFSVASNKALAFFDDIKKMHINEVSLQSLPASALGTDSGNVVDVVFFYQPSYVVKYGESEAIRRIKAWVDFANNSYAVHGHSYTLNINDIVPTESVPDDIVFSSVVNEDGSISYGADDYFSTASLNKGSPEYEIYQEKWKADLVVYVREKRESDGDINGTAGIGGELSNILDDGGVAETYGTLAHEIGHNLGMDHEVSVSNSVTDYARAFTCGGKRTIMYSASNRSNELNHYSAPDISLDGEVCGNEDTANNARVLAENFSLTSQRREGVEVLGNVDFNAAIFTGDEESGVAITLVRDGNLSESASVRVFTTDGTATKGTDYTQNSMTAEFDAGSATTTVNFPVINDGEAESTETLSVYLEFPYKLSIDSASTAILNITNNVATGNVGVFSISGSDELTEGESTQYVVTRTGGAGEAVVNVVTTAVDTLSGDDYVALNEQLVFLENETQKTITFNSIDDESYEITESLTIGLESGHADIEYATQSITISLLDNDESLRNAGEFTLSVNSTSVSESTNSVIFTIARTEGFDGEVVINATTTDGTASAGVDFVALNSDVVFAHNERTKTFSVDIIDNDVDDVSTTFTVSISSSDVNVTVSELSITINDNDSASSNNDSDSSGGGSFGFGFVLLLGLMTIFRNSGLYANKKSI